MIVVNITSFFGFIFISSDAEAEILRMNEANTVAADVSAHCVDKPPEDMALPSWDNQYKCRISMYGYFHYKDATVVRRPSYLYTVSPMCTTGFPCWWATYDGPQK